MAAVEIVEVVTARRFAKRAKVLSVDEKLDF